MPLVDDPRVDLVSFTGSAATGRQIAEAAGRRLAKTVMEMGGKNALVVCDDADLDRAVEWTLASAFSNAGQRCAAASRIVVFDAVVRRASASGCSRRSSRLDDVGPVISEQSMERILGAVESALGCGGDGARGRLACRRPRLARRPDRRRGRPDRCAARLRRALRPCRGPLPRLRLRGGGRARQRVALWAHRGDPHREPPSGTALRGAGRGRRRGRQRRHARQRAAHGFRRRQAVGDGLEGGRRRGARRLLARRSTSTSSSTPSSHERPIAVLGPGGIGGMLAARTGAICVGTERTVAAIRAAGLTLVHGERTIVTHPERSSVSRRRWGSCSWPSRPTTSTMRSNGSPRRPLGGAVVLPLLNGLEHVDAIRERFGTADAVSGARPVVAAGSIGRVEAFSPEPGLVVQRTPGAAVSRRRLATRAAEPRRARSRRSRPGIDVVVADDEPAVLWEKAARLAVLAAATAASGRADRRAPRDTAVARAPRARLWGRPCAVAAADGVAVAQAAMGDHRGHARRPHDLGGP